MQLWEGDYTRALTKVARQSFVLTRVGRTLADALADRPVAIGTTAEGQIFTGSGSDLGPPTAVEISPRRASAARIPASLGGNRSSDVPLQTWEITLKPSYVSENDGIASNYQAVWVYPKSPTTPYRSPDSHHQQSRYLLLDPRARDSDGRAGRDEWWFVIERTGRPASTSTSTEPGAGSSISTTSQGTSAGIPAAGFPHSRSTGAGPRAVVRARVQRRQERGDTPKAGRGQAVRRQGKAVTGSGHTSTQRRLPVDHSRFGEHTSERSVPPPPEPAEYLVACPSSLAPVRMSKAVRSRAARVASEVRVRP